MDKKKPNSFFNSLKECTKKISDDVDEVMEAARAPAPDKPSNEAAEFIENRREYVEQMKTDVLKLQKELRPKFRNIKNYIFDLTDLVIDIDNELEYQEEYLEKFGYKPLPKVLSPTVPYSPSEEINEEEINKEEINETESDKLSMTPTLDLSIDFETKLVLENRSVSQCSSELEKSPGERKSPELDDTPQLVLIDIPPLKLPNSDEATLKFNIQRFPTKLLTKTAKERKLSREMRRWLSKKKKAESREKKLYKFSDSPVAISPFQLVLPRPVARKLYF